MTETPSWLERLRTLDAEQARLNDRAEHLADQRALIVADAVASTGRGGRARVAETLGCTVGRIDQHLARARGVQRRPLLSHLPAPDDLLERLYAAELAAVDLTDDQRQALGHLARGLVIDATWLEQLGELLAAEYAEAAADGDVPADDALVSEIRSWTPIRALAVLHSLQADAA